MFGVATTTTAVQESCIATTAQPTTAGTLKIVRREEKERKKFKTNRIQIKLDKRSKIAECCRNLLDFRSQEKKIAKNCRLPRACRPRAKFQLCARTSPGTQTLRVASLFAVPFRASHSHTHSHTRVDSPFSACARHHPAH